MVAELERVEYWAGSHSETIWCLLKVCKNTLILFNKAATVQSLVTALLVIRNTTN